MKEHLIQEIKQKLGIDGGMFIDAEIESYIDEIPESRYIEFFKALSGEHGFLKPIDRIAKVAKSFKQEKTDNLLTGTREQAKAMYDKFYDESAFMLDYTQKDRSKTPDDRAFFRGVDYAKLKKTDGSMVYTKQELYVLDYLGGGDWLMDIRFASNSNEVICKIEAVIKDAKVAKYGNLPAISRDVKKMIEKSQVS